ncbi:hypothetical protein P170DRAFT_501122 [Aspergillus steynii IBT 23096]|uniref:HNH nuclease domain-containing protein n=1 Tax=Aspergillus steynii IBT 23096 TaxID=1392250 RepID=A0A2I2G003_9EURO|nr:uncharacterized protein P170DRAFT_501122 [Aspergillus steynii IBT 23096]PLB46199.1 hypothetical protein P170DRAFT_501122 [Aspergillus steynii IBT 23096]
MSQLDSYLSSISSVEQQTLQRLEKYTPLNEKDDTRRVLLAFLENLPQDGKANLIDDILDCPGDLALNRHARSLVEGLLFPFRVQPKTPSIIASERFRKEATIENVSLRLDDLWLNNQKCLKAACLRRDRRKCLITGAFDTTYAAKSDAQFTPTKCAPILPIALGRWENKERCTSAIWVLLDRCFPSLRSSISFTPSSINTPCNAITMSAPLHDMFGRFNFTLIATDKPHVYQIRNFTPRDTLSIHLPRDGLVKFEQNGTYKLPCPLLLSIHATIAKILHATGKAKEADRVLKDKDMQGALARDGSTDIVRLLSVTSLAYRRLNQP